MDLWIRSQSDYGEQNLIKAEHIKVELVIDNIWEVKVNNERVAEYNSRKRAIEVLDEIQKAILEGEEDFKGMVVYQMPAEDEAK